MKRLFFATLIGCCTLLSQIRHDYGGQLVENGINNVGTVIGLNTYTASPTPAVVALTVNVGYCANFVNGNTSAATLNVNSLGAVAVVKQASTPLVSGDIAAGSSHCFVFNGTSLVLDHSDTVSNGTGGVGQCTLTSTSTAFSVDGNSCASGGTAPFTSWSIPMTTNISTFNAPANWVAGQRYSIQVTQNSSTVYTIAWNTAWTRFVSVPAPTELSKTTELSGVWDGSFWNIDSYGSNNGYQAGGASAAPSGCPTGVANDVERTFMDSNGVFSQDTHNGCTTPNTVGQVRKLIKTIATLLPGQFISGIDVNGVPQTGWIAFASGSDVNCTSNSASCKVNGIQGVPVSTTGPTSGQFPAYNSSDLQYEPASNAPTATALAATPSQCTGTQFATGVSANGNAACASLPTNSPTATALAATPSQCTGTQVAAGVAANGNAICVTPSSSVQFTSTTLYAPISSGTVTVTYNSITAAKVLPTVGALSITLALTAPTGNLSTPMLLGLCNPTGTTETWSLPGNAVNIVTPSDPGECAWNIVAYDSSDSSFNGPGSTAVPSVIKFSAQRTDPTSVTPGGELNPNSATGNLDYTGPDLSVRAPVLKGADINPDSGQVTGLGHVTNGSLPPSASAPVFSTAGSGNFWPLGVPVGNTAISYSHFSNTCTTTCNVEYYEFMLPAAITFSKYRFRVSSTAAASQYIAMAVYGSSGSAIASSECTAGVSLATTFAIGTCSATSATTLSPGVYFLAISGTSTTATLVGGDPANNYSSIMNADSTPRVFIGSNTTSQTSGTFTWPATIGTRGGGGDPLLSIVLMP